MTEPGTPVFVDDTGRRRRVTRGVWALVAVALVAASVAAVFALVSTGGPATAGPRQEVAAARAGDEFAIDTASLGPDRPASATPCRVVQGTVYLDTDLNGARLPSGESGVPGVEVDVVDTEGRSTTALTARDGTFRIALDEPSLVRVQFRALSDELIATPLGPTSSPWVSFPVDGPECEVTTGALYRDWFEDPSILETPTREIGDRVWFDRDADGEQDPSEPGIAGVRLQLLDADGRVVATTTSSSTGEYRFGGLRDDRPYAVRVVATTDPQLRLVPTQRILDRRDEGTVAELAGAAGRDSDLYTEDASQIVLLPSTEPGASDHSFDLGFTLED